MRVSFSHHYRSPSRTELAGGDVIALSRHDRSSPTLLIADVSAKGARGRALAAWLAMLFHFITAATWHPSHILTQLNKLLAEGRLSDPASGLFASAFVCRFLPAKSHFIYSSAGAVPPLLASETKDARALSMGGVVLGVDPDAEYDDRVVRIAPNDVLVAFTDGITESRRHSVPEQVGSHGVLRAVQSSFRQSALPDSESILSHIETFNGGIYHDDATLLVAAVLAG